MNIKTIIFDLDGTLLPMDLALFKQTTSKLFVEKMEKLGYDPVLLKKARTEAFRAMVLNEGKMINSEAHDQKLAEYYGEELDKIIHYLDEYYDNEFDDVRKICGFNPEAGPAVTAIAEQGYQLVLATMPWFPANAINARLRWAGVDPAHFCYMTLYDNSRYCKPKMEYYKELISKLQLNPEECLMVGNDVQEDMIVTELGMQVFLMPEYLICRDDTDIHIYPHGNFQDLLAFLNIKN